MDSSVINGYRSKKKGLDSGSSPSSKMDDDAAREDACREYQSSLEDLIFNSKPHINMLTILAEENLQFAKDIVAIIEAQINKAPSSEKLPVLYLVDSIVKNVGGEYLEVFAKNLVASFICVFEKVDENIRKSLFKLRSTWDDVFPLKKLYSLDVRVNSLDPAWPIKPLPPTVNASIHVNPKFLKQSDEPSPKASTPQPAAPPAQPVPATSEGGFTQEQLIRQQLLAKQKQLLELQQKKIELELEQTKAQLAGGFVLTPPVAPASAPAAPAVVPKVASQSGPVIRPWIPPQADSKPSTRDPRLNRAGPAVAPLPKELPGKKDSQGTTGPTHTLDKRLPEKSSKSDKTRIPKKEPTEEKLQSKSLSPMPPKATQSKIKQSEPETPKTAMAIKKDPRLRKRMQDKAGEAKDQEQKEKKRCSDKKEKEENMRSVDSQKLAKDGKLVNGSVSRHDHSESADRAEYRRGGNARTNARKRTRSRSRSPSSTSSPKRKERRSSKGRARSSSSSPSPSHKTSKGRLAHVDEPQHGKPGREERVVLKKSQPDPKRTKRPLEERRSESRDSHSPRTHAELRETKDAPHRWRSGWEENKHLKPSEDSHRNSGPQRHKPYNNAQRPPMPRTPKHRLSADANLQIPDVLNSANKRDLLRRANKRLESGELSQEDFLGVAHQINQLFQYQEEKQQRSDSWETPSEEESGSQQQFPAKKTPLLATPPSPQNRSHDGMAEAELLYYEHKSKLKRTRVTHRSSGAEWEGEDAKEEGDLAGQGGKLGSAQGAKHPSPHKYTRPPRERQGERHSKEREEQSAQQPQTPMIEEYNHGKEFPTLKSLPGLRFRRRADPRESSEREWNSPLTERQRYDEREEQKSSYDAPRRYSSHPDSRHNDPRRQERQPPSATVIHRNCSSPVGLDAPVRCSPGGGYERERLSPLHQVDAAEMSPIPRFESPNSEHSDDGPLDIPPPSHPPALARSILKAPARGPLSSVRHHSDSPAHTPPHEGGHPPSRYDGPGHIGPSRPHPGQFENSGPSGRYEDTSRYDGPHHQGPGRFDGSGPTLHNIPERFDGPSRYDGPPVSHGPIRSGDGMGRFEGAPHSQGTGMFEGPIGQQPSVRFDGKGSGPVHFEGPLQCFDEPRRFDNNMVPGPGPMGFQQQGPIRFDGPLNQMGPARFEGPVPMRFDGPGHPGPRYDVPNIAPRFDCPQGQQVPPRFGPTHNIQPPMRPLGPTVYDNSGPPQQNFTMANQGFSEPMNSQYSGGQLPFHAQQNLPRGGGNFPMQPGPSFNQPAGPPFYNPAAPPAGNMQQPGFSEPMNSQYSGGQLPFHAQQNLPRGGGNFPMQPGPSFNQPAGPPFYNPAVNMMPNLAQPFLPQNPVPYNQPAPQFNPPESHFGQVDVNDLLSKLISTGIIPGSKPSQPEPTTSVDTEPLTVAPPPLMVEEEEEEEQEVEEEIPDLTSFIIDDMKQRYESVVTKLYTGIQCYSCGMRFTSSQTDIYADHLDWHYRQNRSEKDVSRKITHRRWYYTLTDWIEFEEIADLEERAKSQFFEKVNEEQKSQEVVKEEFQSVKATTDVVGESCDICQEAFEMYWEEEEEEWHLKNAIRVDGKTYHPSCFEDYKNTSSFLDITPSPNKVLTEHPLSAFIKQEDKEEEVTPCVAVKQEVEPEGKEAQNVKEDVDLSEGSHTSAIS